MMKNDLISRSALMRHIEEQYREWGEDYDAGQILGDIEDAPAACDIEGIIEQLENMQDATGNALLTVQNCPRITKQGIKEENKE